MPAQTRPADQFTRDNLLIGFSIIEFTPTGGSAVPLGILQGEELQKAIETLQLQRGDAGLLTVDRELISSFEASLSLSLFNFRADIAEYIFGSTTGTAQSTSTVAITNEPFNIPLGALASDTFVSLKNAFVLESPAPVLTARTITAEAVGTGNGTLGTTLGDFALDYKVAAIGNVTSLTVAGTPQTVVAGAPAAPGEVQVATGTGATSGQLDFFAAPANGAAIVATYTPSFAPVLNTNFFIDPIAGRIRVIGVNGDTATGFFRSGQPMELDYSYTRRASTLLKPFTRLQVDGSATVKHLTDIGINFIWTIPSVTIRATDDALTFGADDFATATLQMNINDAGSPNRFGDLQLFSETQAAIV